MDNENAEVVEDQINDIETDPWEAAFAAINQKVEEATKGDTNTYSLDDGAAASAEITEASGENNGTDQSIVGNGDEISDSLGRSGDPDGEPSLSNGDGKEDLFGGSEEEIAEYRKSIVEDAEQRAMSAVAKAYIDKGARHTNGKLGASINDPDICKRDSDGVPHFYNPDTGREFTGDNPRRQAQEWCNDYNEELAENFNRTCRQYADRLIKQEEPRIAVREFAPKYEKLDPIRQAMFEEVIADYEILDEDGGIIGYACDLNKALASVDRQVARIQSYAKNQTTTQTSSGPALDMKSSASSVSKQDDKGDPKSLAEALERMQNAELDAMKKKGN